MQTKLIDELPDFFDVQISKDFRIIIKGPDAPVIAIKKNKRDNFWAIGSHYTVSENDVPKAYYVRAIRKLILASGFVKDHYDGKSETTYRPIEQLAHDYKLGLLDNSSAWLGYVDHNGNQVGKSYEPSENVNDFERLKKDLKLLLFHQELT